MKVWASRRRDDGAALAEAQPVVECASLLELVVVEVTLEGNSRPAKVARLRPIGEPRILAQLLLPKPVKLQGWTFVLSGIEELKQQPGAARGVAQTWVCDFWTPAHAVGFRVKNTFQHGAKLPKSGVRDTSSTRGTLVIGTDFVTPLQRHAICAEVHHHQMSTFLADRLVDCHIEWMSDETFELGGLRVWNAQGDRPERLERAGWLCEIDVEQQQLTKAEYRALR